MIAGSSRYWKNSYFSLCRVSLGQTKYGVSYSELLILAKCFDVIKYVQYCTVTTIHPPVV